MTATDEEVFDTFPRVFIDRDNIEHYRGMLARKLLINRCSACGYWIYPHRPLCPECLSWDVVPTAVSGDGTLYMFTLVHQERDPSRQPVEPLLLAAIELAERPGLRYLSTIVNCPRDQVALDMPVRLTWVERDGNPAPAFEPAIGSEFGLEG